MYPRIAFALSFHPAWRKIPRHGGKIHPATLLVFAAFLGSEAPIARWRERFLAAGYITVEGEKSRRVDIALKGKIRTILLPKKLCGKPLDCRRKMQIPCGKIFRMKSGRDISRRQTWYVVKRLYKVTGVVEGKIFPYYLW